MVNSTFDNESQSNTRWSYGTTSLVESEMMEDMGVNVLEDEENCENTKKVESEDYTECSVSLDDEKTLMTNETDFEYQQHGTISTAGYYTSSNLETVNTERFVIKKFFKKFTYLILCLICHNFAEHGKATLMI